MTRFTELLINAMNTLASRVEQSEGDRGAVMVEYALLVALIGVVLIGVIEALTGGISGAFTEATNAL